MERLLSSSPPSSFSLFPSGVLRKTRYPFPSRLGRVDSPKLAPPPTEWRPVGSVSCSRESAPSGHPPSVDKPPPLLTRGVDSPPGLVPTSQFPGKNAVADSPQLKVTTPYHLKEKFKAEVGQHNKAISSGTFVLLSALIVALIHPLFASPAFATFQNAVKTGGPAAATAVGRSLLCTEVLSSAWTGFFAGCLHTLSGPDHLAALAPLSIGRTKMESAAVGALWGCGHDAGQVIFGLLFLMLKDRLHIEVFRTWGSRVVGLTLLVIGAMGIREASEVPTPCVALENGECNVGTYETMVIPAPIGGQKKKKIGFATFATGIVHGLQPDALMMVLPALALPSRLAGAAFLIMFLGGTVVAMGSYTVFIGSCSKALKDRVPRITERLTWASSLLAIGLGFAILISQLFGYSLY